MPSPKGNRKEVVKKELRRLLVRDGGILTPSSVIEAAKDPKNPLHSCFQWDDRKAANLYRVEQARHLIRSVQVEIVTETRLLTIPVYVRDPDAVGRESGYTALSAVSGEQAKQRVVEQEMNAAIGCLRRASDIALSMNDARLGRLIDRKAKQIETLIKQLIYAKRTEPVRAQSATRVRPVYAAKRAAKGKSA